MLRFFYERCYKPYVTARHGDVAFITDYQSLERLFAEGELLVIKRAGEVVAMALHHIYGDEYVLYYNGIIDGDEKLFHDGAAVAMYVFAHEVAASHGCKTLNLGRSRAFLDDGVLFYKKKWGGEILRDYLYWPAVTLLVGVMNKATHHALTHNPFLAEGPAGIEAWIFLGDDPAMDPQQLDGWLRKHRHPGCARMNLVALTERWREKLAALAEAGHEPDLLLHDYAGNNTSVDRQPLDFAGKAI